MVCVVKKDRIDSMFDRIKILTAILLENFSVEQFHETMQERSNTINLLKREIEQERETRIKENQFFLFEKKVTACLNEIKEMDAKVIALIKSKMDEIRIELCSLTKKGTVAMAYTSHKRT